jgi:hypothetical protein
VIVETHDVVLHDIAEVLRRCRDQLDITGQIAEDGIVLRAEHVKEIDLLAGLRGDGP